MIDTAKLVARIDEALSRLDVLDTIAQMMVALAPLAPETQLNKGRNEGVRKALEALKLGIEEGVFDVRDTIPAPPPEPTKFGVFVIFSDGDSQRSANVPDEFDTISEAWSAVRCEGSSACDYDVRPL